MKDEDQATLTSRYDTQTCDDNWLAYSEDHFIYTGGGLQGRVIQQCHDDMGYTIMALFKHTTTQFQNCGDENQERATVL